MPPMDELNTVQSVEMIELDGHDTLSLVDMGEAIAISQVADDGTFHNVVIGLDQAEKLGKYLAKVLEASPPYAVDGWGVGGGARTVQLWLLRQTVSALIGALASQLLG